MWACNFTVGTSLFRLSNLLSYFAFTNTDLHCNIMQYQETLLQFFFTPLNNLVFTADSIISLFPQIISEHTQKAQTSQGTSITGNFRKQLLIPKRSGLFFLFLRALCVEHRPKLFCEIQKHHQHNCQDKHHPYGAFTVWTKL